MRVLNLDAAEWREYADFVRALLAALEAPHWHGDNVNALIDSMVHGGINGVEPPYDVVISGFSLLAPDLCIDIAATIGFLLVAQDETYPSRDAPRFRFKLD